MGSGLLYLAIVILWGAVLVPMWLKRLTQDELGSIDKFNKSMSLLGSVPQLEVPTYRVQTPTQIAAARRRRTVMTLSGITVLGTAIAVVTGIWILMITPAFLLFGFFFAAWRTISKQTSQVTVPKQQKRLNVSRTQLAAQAKEWNAAPSVLPNRVVGERATGLTGQQMLDLAAAQVESVAVEAETTIDEVAVSDQVINNDIDQQSATG